MIPKTIVLLLVLVFQAVSAFKILCLMTVGSKSNEHIFIPVIEELIKNNHQVTCVWPRQFSKKIDNPNLKIIPMVQEALSETNIMQNIFEVPSMSPLVFFASFNTFVSEPCEIFFQNKEVQLLIKGGIQYDIAVVNGFMNDCTMAISPLVANYTVILSPNIVMPWLKVTVPRPPSFVPHLFSGYTDEMTFFQRLHNSFYHIAIMAIYDYHLLPTFEKIAFKYVPKAVPIAEVLDKTSLVLTNTDPITISPRPTMPNVVSIGCIHCEQSKPVPGEFEEFIKDSGDDGFILFSMGSNAQSKYLPEHVKLQLLKVFSNLKQRVIWKYEEEMNNLPINLKVTKWMPQQDLLGHPKIRLFITHGGLLSLQQAVYHSVPVIGIPVFFDQTLNMARMQQLGIGLMLDFNNITTDNLQYLIKKMLQDDSYATNMRKYSNIFRDEMGEPAKKAVYWLQYVIRHSGANHLKNNAAKELNCMQYYLLDFILYPILTFVLIIMTLKIMKFV